MASTQNLFLKTCALIILAGNIFLWHCVRDIQSRWAGVPPVPGKPMSALYGLGDKQLSYRAIGLMLQNMGETGGRSVRLARYDYERLVDWFAFAGSLDPRSDFIPFLAAFYYGAVTDSARLAVLLDYLYEIGQGTGPNDWRWLAHGVYIARYQMNDLDRALKFARTLSSLPNRDLPVWARQMPAFILDAQGEKDEALAIMMEILASGVNDLHPNEVRYMQEYICARVMSGELAHIPFCKDIK